MKIEGPSGSRVYVARGSFPLWALALLAPAALLMLMFSFAIVAGGGLIAALVLPFLFRRSVAAPRRDDSVIELEPSQYRTIKGPKSRGE